MKKNIKVLPLKVATMMLVGFTAMQALQPVDVQAAYKTPYEYAQTQTPGTLVQDASVWETRATNIWFKAIYPEVSATNKMDTLADYQAAFKAIFGQDVSDKTARFFTENNFFNRDPFKGYDPQTIQDDFAKLDASKQYFPTMEFPVGQNYCYIDGKKFMLEDKIIQNKDGVVLVPWGHLQYVLSSQPTIDDYIIQTDKSQEGFAILLNTPWSSQNEMNVTGIDRTGQIMEVSKFNRANPKSPAGDQDLWRPATKDDKIQGAFLKDKTMYVPVKWLALGSNAKKAEWYQAQKLAVIPGNYSPGAVNYGIFKQPNSSSKYDLFKDWDMMPNQPVRNLSKNLAK